MDHPSEAAQADSTLPPGPLRAAKGVLAARQVLQCRLGLPLAVLGGMVLLLAVIKFSELRRPASLSILAGATALAAVLIVYAGQRTRHEGIWAKPADEPSLDSPLATSGPDSKRTARVQLVGLILAGSLMVGAYLYGVALDTLMFWIIAYGIVHMIVYTLSLWLSLGMREQALPVVWFVAGGVYWISTGRFLALVLGGGWVLTGLLLWYRLRCIEKLVDSSAVSDRFGVTP